MLFFNKWFNFFAGIFKIDRSWVPTEEGGFSIIGWLGFILRELGRKVAVHDSETELDIWRYRGLSKFIQIGSEVVSHFSNAGGVERSGIGVDGVLVDVGALDLLDFLEERHDDKSVVLYLWTDLVLLADLNSFKLDNQASVDVVLGLEHHIIIFKGQLAPFRTVGINCPHNLQILVIFSLWCVIFARGTHAHCHKIVIVFLVLWDNQLIDWKIYPKKLLVLSHVLKWE